jgi:hypothetical protein
MDKKLTLSLNEDVIEQAKKYAAAKNISLSKLIEAYLQRTSSNQRDKNEISPLVKSLSGVIKLKKGLDERQAYSDYLYQKYQSK